MPAGPAGDEAFRDHAHNTNTTDDETEDHAEGQAADEPAPAPPGPVTLTRGQKALVAVVLIGAITIATLGFVGSYHAVRDLAVRKGFGDFAPVFPVALDAGIVVLLALDLLLTWLRIPYPLLRQTAWLLTAATITFNAASAWGDPLAMAMHGVIPLLFILVMEAGRNGIAVLAQIADGRRVTYPPARLWLVAPITTARVWRTQTRLGLDNYHDVIDRRRDTRVYRARMRQEHGRRWRKNPERALPLRLARYGLTVDEARQLPQKEEEADQQTQHNRKLAGLRREHLEQQTERALNRQQEEEQRDEEEENERRDEEKRQRAEEAERQRQQRAEIAEAKQQADLAEQHARQAAADAEAQAAQRIAAARAAAEEQRLAAEAVDAEQRQSEEREARRRERDRAERLAEEKAEEETRQRQAREEAARAQHRQLFTSSGTATANHGEPTVNPERTTNPEPLTPTGSAREANHDLNLRTEPAANHGEPRRTQFTPEAGLTRELRALINERGYWAVTLPFVQTTYSLKKTTAHKRLRAARLAWGSEQAQRLIEEHGDSASPDQLMHLGMSEELATEAFAGVRALWQDATASEPSEPNHPN